MVVVIYRGPASTKGTPAVPRREMYAIPHAQVGFSSQCDYRIDASRAACRNEAGDRSFREDPRDIYKVASSKLRNICDNVRVSAASDPSRGGPTSMACRTKAYVDACPDNSSGQVSRLLKRLPVHGLIKKVGHTYKYYLTQFGKAVYVICYVLV